jgi:hypothetical protein
MNLATKKIKAFDCHGDAASYWMPPLGKCLCRIAPAAAMANKLVIMTQNTNKTQLLACN